jgi:deoxyribodipyrimidine photo-lyase
MKVNIFWYRRDLRLEDNKGLIRCLEENLPVLPIFIFDRNILAELPKDDARVSFIYQSIEAINRKLKSVQRAIRIYHGEPIEIFTQLATQYEIGKIYCNEDYEPYAVQRDVAIQKFLKSKQIGFEAIQDHVFFHHDEVLKNDGHPYTVYTPYKNKWRAQYEPARSRNQNIDIQLFMKYDERQLSLEEMGFQRSSIKIRGFDISEIESYESTRDIPSKDSGSKVGPHLRFGTVSIRELMKASFERSETFFNELIWREFFIQILHHYPDVVNHEFKSKYSGLLWRNNEKEFERWKNGDTGIPLVDAGMRELNETGYMHNRVRMITAGFLCKNLLIDWRWGEAYFALKLNDFELASNNGNWQWCAGTGCDAAPYFRVFNPESQRQKFDPKNEYVKKWVPEFETSRYSSPMVDLKSSRNRAIETYRNHLQQ